MALSDVKLEQEKYLNNENVFEFLRTRNNIFDVQRSWAEGYVTVIGNATAEQIVAAKGVSLTKAQALVAYKQTCLSYIAWHQAEVDAGRLIRDQIKAEPTFTA